MLETTWTSDDGVLVLVDALTLGSRERGHDLGRSSPGVLLRTAHCTQGTVEVGWEYAPRPEFGLIHPQLLVVDGGVLSHGGATTLFLSTENPAGINAATASGTTVLQAGQRTGWALQQTDPWADTPPQAWNLKHIQRRAKETERGWRSWSDLHQQYEGPQRALVHTSGLMLQALSYAPSAAPHLSLTGLVLGYAAGASGTLTGSEACRRR